MQNGDFRPPVTLELIYLKFGTNDYVTRPHTPKSVGRVNGTWPGRMSEVVRSHALFFGSFNAPTAYNGG